MSLNMELEKDENTCLSVAGKSWFQHITPEAHIIGFFNWMETVFLF